MRACIAPNNAIKDFSIFFLCYCCCWQFNKRHRALCTLIKSFHIRTIIYSADDSFFWVEKRMQLLSTLKFPSFLCRFFSGENESWTCTWWPGEEEDYARRTRAECHNWKISLITRHLLRNLLASLFNDAIKNDGDALQFTMTKNVKSSWGDACVCTRFGWIVKICRSLPIQDAHRGDMSWARGGLNTFRVRLVSYEITSQSESQQEFNGLENFHQFSQNLPFMSSAPFSLSTTHEN